MIIAINDSNQLVFRDTPWDSTAFGFKTNEILSIEYSDLAKARILLEKFEEYCTSNGVRFTYVRINAQDFLLKNILQLQGYYFVETSLSIFHNRISTISKENKRVVLTLAEAPDIPEIQKIASEDFNYSRFHEDSNIDIQLSRKRYFNWIPQLVANNQELYVARSNDKIIGFHAQSVDEKENSADLILSGCNKANSMLSISLWESIFAQLQNRGILKARTVISASNINIINLYTYFNFKTDNTKFDFHKFR